MRSAASRLRILIAVAALACSGDSPPTSVGTTPTTPTDTTHTGTGTDTSAAYTLTIITVASQSSPAGVMGTSGLAVKLADSTGAAVSGQTLTWTVAGGGSVFQGTTVTDSAGHAVNLWTLGPTANTQTLTVSNSHVATPAVFTGMVPIASIAFAPAATRLYIGDSLTVSTTIRDANGTVLTGTPSLVVRDTSIAGVTGAGNITGKFDGSTYVVAVTGPLNTPRDSTKVDFYRTLRGTVYTYDDSPLPALRAYSTNGGVTDSTNVNADGSYTLKLTSHGLSWTTEVLIDAVNKAARTFFPALMPVANHCRATEAQNCYGSDAAASISFVLVPMHYTVPTGIYAGQILNVDLNEAGVTSIHTGPSYLGVSGVFHQTTTSSPPASTVQNLYAFGEQAWLKDSFPIAVAVHRGCCTARNATPDDSVQLWKALNKIQTTLGLSIWYPINDQASFKNDRLTSTTPNRTLVFEYDSLLKGAVTGGASTGPIGTTLVSPQTLMLQDFVITGWRGSATDHVTISNQMSQSQTVAINPSTTGSLTGDVLVHEAMHTLGMGHGCQWVSTQSYCGMETPDTLPSFKDAAYLLLSMDVKAATWKHHALHSLTAALFGQRAIIMGVDPVPAPWTLPEPGGIGGTFDRVVRPGGGGR